MSFSHEMKDEITENRPLRMRYKKAHAYGLFAFASAFGEGEVALRTEHREVALLFEWLARSLLGRTLQVDWRESTSRGKAIYTVSLPQRDKRIVLLQTFDHRAGINREILPTPGDEAAFLSGAFLACGNVTDPHKSYHIEFVAREQELARELCALLGEHIPGAKLTKRRSSYVVYYKECGQIEDLMTLLGASRSCLVMIDVELIKSVRNQANRATNCETANIDKLVSAAAAQMEDIRFLLENGGEDSLPENLRAVARLRLEHPDSSLRELAELSPEKLSRSGIHHRLEKLCALAAQQRERDEKPPEAVRNK